ncbi:MAG: hypothetical protein CMJ35_00100 [Phycisphaerae bacterium]|nr:hypothetical protein [Phycisphaerae bacterium]MBM90000.1 hypothetical protein [Phycisphaerae bacterium]
MKTPQPTSRRVRLALSLALIPVFSGGCQLFNEKLTAEPGPIYPENAPMIEVLDVQLFRDVTTLSFTNTTTTDFPAGTLWLNKRYSAPMPPVAAGETIELDLRQFVDEYGDTYKAGGFFAQREPAPVVLAQIELPGNEGEQILYGLVVVQNKYD